MPNNPIAIVVDYSYYFMDFYDTVSFSMDHNVPPGCLEEIIMSSSPEDIMSSAFAVMRMMMGPKQNEYGRQWIMLTDITMLERHKQVQAIMYPEYGYSNTKDLYSGYDLELIDYLFSGFKRSVTAVVNPDGQTFICNEEVTVNALYKILLEIILMTSKALLNMIVQRGLNEIEYSDIDLSCVRQIDETSYTFLLQLKNNIHQ